MVEEIDNPELAAERYVINLTETCDPGNELQLITQGQTALFTNGRSQAKLNGRLSSPEPTADQSAETQPGKGMPKPPRPRLFVLPSSV